MNPNYEKIDEAALALLYLTLNAETGQAWKGMDFDITNRLYEKGLIGDPINKNKSLWVTKEGVAASESLFRQLFCDK
jgi:hypothetical protein